MEELTTKEKEVIWDEKNSTEPTMKSVGSGVSVECGITITTSDLNGSGHLLDTITTKTSGIYKIVNKVNGKYYMGSSSDIKRRWRKHKNCLRRRVHPNKHLERAWHKYEENNFEFIMIENSPVEDLLKCEQQYLDKCRNDSNFYNVSHDASSPMLGRKHSIEARIKMSLKHKGIKQPVHSEESRKRQSETLKKRYERGLKHPLQGTHHSAGTSNPMYGKHHSNETRQKISNALTGIPLSRETIEKLSLIRRDKTIYNLVNIQTNETFVGTKQDFIRNYNNGNRCYSIYQMFKGIRKYHEWKLKSFSVDS